MDSIFIQSIVQTYGYIGIFIISIISGFNLVVPIPIISFLPLFLESGLNQIITIIAISIGLTGGDILGYVIGNIGRDAMSDKSIRIQAHINSLHDRFPSAPYILLAVYSAFVPLPNEILVIPLAFLGYRLKYIFPIVFVGNFIFNILSAYAINGLYGLIIGLFPF